MSHDNFNEYCPKCHRRSLSSHSPIELYENEAGKYVDVENLKKWELYTPMKVRIHLKIGSATCTDCGYYRLEGDIEGYGEWITIEEVKDSKSMEQAKKEAERTTLAQIKQDKEKRRQLYNDLKKEFGLNGNER